MSFPTSPTNGQTAIVNGINYVYSATNNSWTIVPASIVVDVDASFDQANAAFDKANSAAIAANTPSHVANSAAIYANGAFVAANTPSHVANSAAIYANGAFTTANTADDKATSAGTYANGAFVAANTPSHVANSAAIYANGAFAQANAAYNHANAAFNNSNSATTLAQNAYDTANLKFDKAGGTISGNVTIANNLSVLGNVTFVGNVTSLLVTGNSGQFFGEAANGFNALYAGIPVGYDFQPQTVFQLSTNFDGYTQVNIQNINNGTLATSDYVATADNGNENDTYIDMGIGSSDHTDPEYTLVGPNDGYLYVSGNTVTGGGDLVLGTILENDLVFAVGGMNEENEQMRIIGTSNTINIRANVDASLSKSVLLGPIANVHITGGSDDDYVRTDGAGNLTFASLTSANVIKVLYDTANASFIAANTPSHVANSASIYANGAFAAANASAETNLTQNTSIAAAFNVANSASVYANSAYDHANAAFNAANTAGGGADQFARDTANASFVRANNSLNANNGGTLTGNLVVWNSNVSVNVVGAEIFAVYPQGMPGIGTSSVSNITGAVRISGGLGVAGNVYATSLFDGQNSFKRVGYINIPDQGAGVAKTSNYTLALGDIGEYVRVGTGGSITIPDNVFSAGDAIMIFNDTSGSITITCTITTAYIAGTDSDKATVSLATRGIASILFISGTVCVIMGNVS